MTTFNTTFNPFYYISSDSRFFLSKLDASLSPRTQAIIGVAVTVFAIFSLGFCFEKLCKKISMIKFPKLSLLNVFKHKKGVSSPASSNDVPGQSLPGRSTPVPRQFSLQREDLNQKKPEEQEVFVDFTKRLVIKDPNGKIISRFSENGEIQIGTFDVDGDLSKGLQAVYSKKNGAVLNLTYGSCRRDNNTSVLTGWVGNVLFLNCKTSTTTLKNVDYNGNKVYGLSVDLPKKLITTMTLKNKEITWALADGKITEL